LVIFDYPFIAEHKSYPDLANKKGIALTVGIAAAIVGSSFLIWYIPQSSPGTLIGPPLADNEVIADVYSRHNVTATDIDAKFERWKNNDLAPGDISAQLVSAKSQTEEMSRQLDNRQPAQEWQKSYDLYVQALDAYTAYLDALKKKVDSGDRTEPDPSLKQKWQDLVEQSVNAIPI
jgi:hypothetical protein